MKNYVTLLLAVSINFVVCRDFYVGMFKKNDILVAQDRLYKERVPFKIQYAKYGRHFKCAITYFRVVDRLGYGPGPKVVITRGGLRKKYIVLRIQSMYNQPISVNIFVGCENRMRSTTRPHPRTTEAVREGEGNDTATEGGSTQDDGTQDGSTDGGQDVTGGDTDGGTDGGQDVTGGETDGGTDGASDGGATETEDGAASDAAPTEEPAPED